MSRKSTLTALATALTLGVAMFSTGSADARGHGGGGGMGSHGGFSGHRGGVGRPSLGRPTLGRPTIGRPGLGRPGIYPRPTWSVGYRRPYWIAPVVTYAVARPEVVAGPCTCLSKEYTPEGAVLFKDRCTNEAAMNPPAEAPLQTTYQTAPVYQTAPAQPLAR
jgi:hypothetical protein